ncbi:MAG: hypothetical protein B6D68_03410, partial [spirochete symbiont of Stewartia floridana]
EIAAADFNSLEILSPGGETLRMDKGEGQWTLSDGYPADPAIVNRILDFLSAPTPVDLVSESEKYGRYELDEKGMHSLKGYKDENLIREIHLGKVSSSNKYSYVLFPGNKNVYTVRGTLVETVSKDSESFRDKLIMEIDRDSVTRISFEAAGENTVILTRGEEAAWTDAEGHEWEKEKINEILGRFISLRAVGFPDDAPSEDEKAAEISLMGASEVNFSLYEKGDEGYPASTSAYPFPVIISSYIGDSILESFDPQGEE